MIISKRAEGSIKTCVYDSMRWVFGRTQADLDKFDAWFYANNNKPSSWWKKFETKTLNEIWRIVEDYHDPKGFIKI